MQRQRWCRAVGALTRKRWDGPHVQREQVHAVPCYLMDRGMLRLENSKFKAIVFCVIAFPNGDWRRGGLAAHMAVIPSTGATFWHLIHDVKDQPALCSRVWECDCGRCGRMQYENK